MKTTLENINKITIKSPRSTLKMKKKIEQGRILGSRVTREHENTYLRAQKMMKGRDGTICSANNGIST
jgi:hypothetical protein